MVPIINCLTSFYAGFVVFSTLGYMAHVKQTDVGSVTQGGEPVICYVYSSFLMFFLPKLMKTNFIVIITSFCCLINVNSDYTITF